MKNYLSSVRLTLYVNRAVALLMLVMIFCFPIMVEHYHQDYRLLSTAERSAILIAFYCSAGAVLLALWHMDRLLGNILRGELFTLPNVRHIRTVRWCCLAVSVVCMGAAFGFPSLGFVSVIMLFLCMVVTVVGQVMAAAVVIREENDLTV